MDFLLEILDKIEEYYKDNPEKISTEHIIQQITESSKKLKDKYDRLPLFILSKFDLIKGEKYDLSTVKNDIDQAIRLRDLAPNIPRIKK